MNIFQKIRMKFNDLRGKTTKITHKDGLVEYKFKGRHHRENGPAITTPNGFKAFFQHGVLTNKPGEPAMIEPDGTLWFYVDGVLHNTKGPAIKGANITEYWIDGKQYSEAEFTQFKQTLNNQWYNKGEYVYSDGKPAVALPGSGYKGQEPFCTFIKKVVS